MSKVGWCVRSGYLNIIALGNPSPKPKGPAKVYLYFEHFLYTTCLQRGTLLKSPILSISTHTRNVISPNFSIPPHRRPPTSHNHSRQPNHHPQLPSLCRTSPPPPPPHNQPHSPHEHPLPQQICTNTTLAIQPQVHNASPLRTACSPLFRSLTAGCQAVTCNAADYATSQLLAEQLCSPLASRNATLGSSVSSAVAAATDAARAATDGKNASDVASLPGCAVSPFPVPPPSFPPFSSPAIPFPLRPSTAP